MESYLETIYNLTMEEEAVIAARLAERFHISPPTVSETLSRMVKQGLVTLDARRNIHLTAEGTTLAESGLRRHRLLERMLVDMFGLDWTEAHEEAHRLEHGLSPMLEERMLAVMGAPATCPHGNPIPGPGRNPTRYLADLDAKRLTGTAVGDAVDVVCISEVVEDESALLRYLGDRHIRPGAHLKVRVHDHERGVTAALNGEDVTIAPGVADKIWVRVVA
jgi:DtxR family Mn-dependent transcriptional regulator